MDLCVKQLDNISYIGDNSIKWKWQILMEYGSQKIQNSGGILGYTRCDIQNLGGQKTCIS